VGARTVRLVSVCQDKFLNALSGIDLADVDVDLPAHRNGIEVKGAGTARTEPASLAEYTLISFLYNFILSISPQRSCKHPESTKHESTKHGLPPPVCINESVSWQSAVAAVERSSVSFRIHVRNDGLCKCDPPARGNDPEPQQDRKDSGKFGPERSSSLFPPFYIAVNAEVK
jgi:hypothetical protein